MAIKMPHAAGPTNSEQRAAAFISGAGLPAAIVPLPNQRSERRPSTCGSTPHF